MAIAVASQSTNAYASAASITITKPTGLAAGDLMVAAIHVTGSETVTTPAGWTQIIAQSHGGQAQTLTTLRKTADSGDAAASDFTFNLSGTQQVAGILFRITGQAGNTIIAASDNDTLTNDGTGTFSGGVTPTEASSLLIFCIGIDQGNQAGDITGYAVVTSNPSWTEAFETERNLTDGNNYIFAVAYAIRTQITATGNYSFSYGGYDGANTDACGQLICVNPAISVTISPSTLNSTGAVQTPTISGGAVVSPSTINASSAILTPISIGQADWSAQGKSTAPTWTNQTKS